MGLNKTQCPHCFTTYVISDEQFRVSEGMVRCGTCRERFQARLISASPNKPRFDPREAFIEPLSEEPAPPPTTPTPFITDIKFTDPHTESDPASTAFTNFSIEESVHSEPSADSTSDQRFSQEPDQEVTHSTTSEQQTKQESTQQSTPESSQENSEPDYDLATDGIETPSVAVVVASIRAQRERNKNDHSASPQVAQLAPPTTTPAPQPTPAPELKPEPSKAAKQAELELPLRDDVRPSRNTPPLTTPSKTNAPAPHKPMTTEPLSKSLSASNPESSPESKTVNKARHTKPASSRNETELIDEVDGLIKDKILSPKSESINEAAINRRRSRPAAARPIKRKKSGFRWLAILLGLLLILLFSATLLYQLWLKQWIKPNDSGRFDTAMQAVIDPLVEQLATRNIELPVRRDLSQLELVSARTETHPTRPSTTLLRVSMINRASITQPLPWLELALRNSEGQLVSRRNLSPRDYLYNNKTTADIGPNQLKKVTIELLAFPKQVTGYELKIISR
ncbi:zinc-ribbon and DUF3426 domain-containing protein [Arenicella xantha]|uniref:Putative Zn finger-like uncharacterized protein n=1 Tax=Arenicella xantha TaxID=644221 RepID=A0A395JPS6_9GAMM|nr:zinc-ribbon and DUF3426 domain-containing protein [Arenicella xantha]RBP53644.1 putative Zn finger-like uncharacterized protein [Arenicella xantha]